MNNHLGDTFSSTEDALRARIEELEGRIKAATLAIHDSRVGDALKILEGGEK
jgi:polysaccharide deacetylase 2 family uncharacterized protein YibQ